MTSDAARIVLIDDDEFVVDALSTVLELWGHRVATARCGDLSCPEFRRIAEAPDGVPDVIIADFRLPNGVNGMDAIAHLYAAWGREVPAILLSGEDSIEPQAAGVLCLRKPIDANRLRGALNDVMTR